MLCSSEEGLLCFLVHLCHRLHVITRLRHVVSKTGLIWNHCGSYFHFLRRAKKSGPLFTEEKKCARVVKNQTGQKLLEDAIVSSKKVAVHISGMNRGADPSFFPRYIGRLRPDARYISVLLSEDRVCLAC